MTFSVELVIGILSLLGVVAAAYIGLRGRKDEVSATQTKTLMDGQDRRIERLEGRLDRVEADLDQARNLLRDERTHSWSVRKALRVGIEFVDNVRWWEESGRIGPLPKYPPTDKWLTLLERPRHPPDEHS